MLFLPMVHIGGHRTAVINEDFFVSHGKVAMEDSEVLLSILVPYTKQVGFMVLYSCLYIFTVSSEQTCSQCVIL